jgi:hypothetical protein
MAIAMLMASTDSFPVVAARPPTSLERFSRHGNANYTRAMESLYPGRGGEAPVLPEITVPKLCERPRQLHPVTRMSDRGSSGQPAVPSEEHDP